MKAASRPLALAVALGACALAVTALAQDKAPPAAEKGKWPAAIDGLKAKSQDAIRVTSTAFGPRGAIPIKHTQRGEGLSPPLTWTKGPDGTKTYVVLVEDTDGSGPNPTVHWVLYNIPATVTALPEGVAKGPKPSTILGMLQGLNQRKVNEYRGMGAPPGQPHNYQFEVFAVDKELAIDPAAAELKTVVADIKDHVLAQGQLIGLFASPPELMPKDPPKK